MALARRDHNTFAARDRRPVGNDLGIGQDGSEGALVGKGVEVALALVVKEVKVELVGDGGAGTTLPLESLSCKPADEHPP